ncbi:MAG: pyridoxamine 5'-phosphate oxidase [Candidatus Nephrothrix sp. EaCA]|nr:MAG: pyridoxamine 5'-phosphate oxidase [Candidatus Nephrothrix sp. EaCA]
MNDLSSLRKEYKSGSLDEESIASDPFAQFSRWWKQAAESGIDEPNAMTLATAGKEGADARIVLLKSFDEQGFVFYTNYKSAKSKAMEENENVCLLFFWKELERQVRIAGKAEKLTAAESIVYFNSRPDGSKLSAWVSPQSAAVAGKAWLAETFRFYQERFKHGEIPKPPHWGGFRVIPSSIEFWQGRPNRLHDRLKFTRQNQGWKMERLAP